MQVFYFETNEDEEVKQFIKDCDNLGHHKSQILHLDTFIEVTIFDVKLEDNTLFELKAKKYSKKTEIWKKVNL